MANCVHHWKIEPTGEPQSQGVCQKCGDERMFDNVTPNTHFYNIKHMTKAEEAARAQYENEHRGDLYRVGIVSGATYDARTFSS